MVRAARLTLASLLAFSALAAPAVAQTFTLSINLDNQMPNFSVYDRVIGIDGATDKVIAYCSTTAFTASCAVDITAGTAVRLAVVALDRYNKPMAARFSAGTGPAAACALSSCAFTMTADAALTASWVTDDGSSLSSIMTTIAGDALGQVLVSDGVCDRASLSAPQVCTASYVTGSTVWLAAVPRVGGRFSGYSGATGPAATCGVDPHCEMALGANATVTATFSALTSVSVAPSSAVGTPGGPPQVFTATGTYSDGVSDVIAGGPGVWSTAPPLPSPLDGSAAAALGGKIYVMGGQAISFDSTSTGNGLIAFDPATQAWTSRTSMSAKRQQAGAATAGGFLYAIGGSVGMTTHVGDGDITTTIVLASVERYDPATDTWSPRAPMPTPRSALATGTVNGIIYAVGGQDANYTPLATVEAYDPATDTWSTKAPMPTPRSGAVGGVIDGILYVAGGNSGATSSSTLEAYDPATNTWTTKASAAIDGASTPFSLGGAGTVADGVLYVTGALATYAYDPVADAWTAKAAMSVARAGVAAASLNGIVYAIGGDRVSPWCCNRTQNAVETYVDSLRWSSSAPGVVRIDQNGVAAPLTPGKAMIVANAAGITCGSSCPVFSVIGPSTVSLDSPSDNSSVTAGAELTIGGWALNQAASTGTGVDAVHVYAAPASGGAIFLGAAPYGAPRPDIGSIFGSQFTNSGFTLKTTSLTAGTYTILAYAHDALTGAFDAARSARITVSAPVSNPAIAVDTPTAGQTVTSSFEVGGWALDAGAPTGTGVDAVSFYVQPQGQPAPGVFVGTGSYGAARSDVAALYGSRFTDTGFHFTVTGLGPGSYTLNVLAHSTVTNSNSITASVPFTVSATALMSIDLPSAEATITAITFTVAGWSIDRSVESTALSGSGVDTLHVYALPNPGSGQSPIFLGVASVGVSRPDVGAIYGSRYATSGYQLDVDRTALGLAPGVYNIAVVSHSSVSGTFNTQAVVRVTLQ